MTLDDETAARIAREVVGGGKAARVYPHSTDMALVRAGYAARDAEVEELRAERGEALAVIEQARDEALAVIEQVQLLADALVQARDERDAAWAGSNARLDAALAWETPADEWEYRARWKRDDDRAWFAVWAGRAAEWMRAGYEVQRRRVSGWEVVPDDRA